MGTTTEVVERLAEWFEYDGDGVHDSETANTLRALAAERDALKAENERLREVIVAAEALAQVAWNYPDPMGYLHTEVMGFRAVFRANLHENLMAEVTAMVIEECER